MTLKQTTGYPHENGMRFEVLASESKRERSLAVFAPSWIKRESVIVTVNGRKTKPALQDGFLVIKRTMKRGDIIEFQFAQVIGPAPLLCPERTPGFHRYMHGPLVLGADSKTEQRLPLNTPIEALGSARYRAGDVTLAPLCDLTDRRDAAKRARSGSIQLLFRD